MAVIIFSSVAGIGASFMSVYLWALLRETRRVKTGLWARLRLAFGGGNNQRQEQTFGLVELAVLPPKAVDNLVVMRSRIETGSHAGRRLAGGSL